MGSFTGIYGSQVLLCGQGGTSGTAQPRQVVISATSVKAAALASKQLLQENGGHTGDTCSCRISTCEASNTALLFRAPEQMQPVLPHNGIFTLSYGFLGCPPWWRALLQAQLSRGQVSPRCPAALAVGKLVSFLQPAISQDGMHHFDSQRRREDSVKQHCWQTRGPERWWRAAGEVAGHELFHPRSPAEHASVQRLGTELGQC